MEQLAQNMSLSLPLNFTAVLQEAQARLDPVCEAVGVPSQNCTLQNTALAIGLGIVLLLQTLRGPAEEEPSKRKTSSESDDESEAAQTAMAAGKALQRPSRPPERYTTSSDDEAEEEGSGGAEQAAGSDKDEQGQEQDEDDETEEGLKERRRAIIEGRQARMKAAIDELTALHSSDDVAKICDALRKHAGKPADCRPAWLALQKRLRALTDDSMHSSERNEVRDSGRVDTEDNPACTENSHSS